MDNPGRRLKVGQYVTVKVEAAAARHEVELPAEAVVEDGRASVVFLKAGGDAYVRRPVAVTRRFRDAVYVAKDAAGVKPGDVVVTAGALMLNEAMEQLPAEIIDKNEDLTTEDTEDTEKGKERGTKSCFKTSLRLLGFPLCVLCVLCG